MIRSAYAAHFGGYEQIPSEVLQALVMGETLIFGEASDYPNGAVVVPCGTSGTCQVALEDYLAALENNPNAVASLIQQAGDVLTDALSADSTDMLGGDARLINAMVTLLLCEPEDGFGLEDALAGAYNADPAAFRTPTPRKAPALA